MDVSEVQANGRSVPVFPAFAAGFTASGATGSAARPRPPIGIGHQNIFVAFGFMGLERFKMVPSKVPDPIALAPRPRVPAIAPIPEM